MRTFEGKTVIITGGSSGVGKVLAGKLVDQGANAALIARDKNKLASVRAELEAAAPAGRKVEVFSCDVADTQSVENTIEAAADALGAPDILINSAGTLKENYFEKLPVEVFREIMDTNFFGTLNCIKAVLPRFKRKGGGRIVNMSSLAGLMGVFGYSAYCSSKYAVRGLSDTLRVELAPQNIRVHVVCPPEFESPMVDELNKGRTPENVRMIHLLPVLKAEDVADAVLAGIEKNLYEIIPGSSSRLVTRLGRLFPSLSRAFTDSNIRKHYRGPDA